jgi:hypothetical protein
MDGYKHSTTKRSHSPYENDYSYNSNYRKPPTSYATFKNKHSDKSSHQSRDRSSSPHERENDRYERYSTSQQKNSESLKKKLKTVAYRILILPLIKNF